MGIGRFAAARLGRRLIMVTRAKGHPELRVDIDWDRIASTSDLSAARIAVVTHNEPKIFTGATTGTRLAISSPQQPWTRADLQALQTQLRRFISPHTRVPDFSVRLTVPAAPEFENLDRFRESTPSHFACSAEVLDDGTAVLRWDNFITGDSSEDYINLFSFSPHRSAATVPDRNAGRSLCSLLRGKERKLISKNRHRRSRPSR
ncbi:hypothetical protein [Tepidiforma flava]